MKIPPPLVLENALKKGADAKYYLGIFLETKTQKHHVKEHINWTVRNVVYFLISKGCNEYYIHTLRNGNTSSLTMDNLEIYKRDKCPSGQI